jgi:hypothetical protein
MPQLQSGQTNPAFTQTKIRDYAGEAPMCRPIKLGAQKMTCGTGEFTWPLPLEHSLVVVDRGSEVTFVFFQVDKIQGQDQQYY